MRFRDMSEHADIFRRFLGEELFPFVEGTFRTIKHRTVFGHSMAGNFTLDTFISHGEMFDHYITAGPSYRESSLGKLKNLIKSDTKFSRSIYFTMGSVVDEGVPTFDGYKAMIELLEQSVPDDLKWQSDLFENQLHLTIPYYSLYNGMTHGFSDYTEPRFVSVNAYKKAGGISMLETFFADRAEKYKVNPGISRDMRLALGYLHVREAKFDQAVVLFENNAKMFPEDVEAVYGLGYGYFKSGRFEDALKVYKEGTILAKAQGDSLISLFKTWIKRTENELAKKH
jgi:tetratricopeptide (TPR) repeat protein